MKTSLDDIARVAGLGPFPRHCVSSVSNVGAAVAAIMQGRTHFYDPGTMAYFGCRVLSARIMFDGIVMATVCTQWTNFSDKTRVYTINFHDLTGTTLNSRDDERGDHATRAQADAAFREFAATLDGARVLGDAIRRERNRALREVKATREALRRFRGTLA